jgi:hypothetical protein
MESYQRFGKKYFNGNIATPKGGKGKVIPIETVEFLRAARG